MNLHKSKTSVVGATEVLDKDPNQLRKDIYMHSIVSEQANIVDFHGNKLISILVDEVPYVAVKPICEAIGVDAEAQRVRIARHPVLSSVAFVTKATGSDGKSYDMLMFPLDKLNGFLFGINANRIQNPEVRERLIQYQSECFDVLADYWQKGVAVNQRAFNRSNPQWLEVRQAGKLVRQEWGDVVHDFVGYAMSQGSKSAQMYYMNITKMQYQALEFVKQSGDKYFRDSLDILQHSQLMSIEFAVQQALIEGMDMGLPYKDIFKFAKERALELAVPLKRLTGNARILHIPVGQRIAGVLA